jgi:hypothetical protein
MAGVWEGTKVKQYSGAVAERCPHCGWLQHPIVVAGHVQCGHCHSVLEACCSGETMQIAEESKA